MWFSLFGLVLILCIAFFQGLQGLFSAVIMTTLTILCAALAMGTFENLYFGFLIDRMPQHGEAVAMMSIFVLSLLVLRTLFDNLVKGNMVFPVWVDRIAGGALGLVTGLIIVGMLQLTFQLLPFDETFLGFNRFPPQTKTRNKVVDDEKELKRIKPEDLVWQRASLLWSPDEFVVGVVERLSGGALSGRTRFEGVHPDFTAEVQNSRCAVQRESAHAIMNYDGAISVPSTGAGYWILPSGRMVRPGIKTDSIGTETPVEIPTPAPPGGFEWRVYRVLLSDDSRDPDQQHRFRAPQVRIVGRDAPGRPTRQYLLKGVQRETNPSQFVELFRNPILGKEEFCDVNRSNPPGMAGKAPFDFVFEVPTTFQAEFIEFKRTARVDVSRLRKLADKEIPRPVPVSGQKTDSAQAAPWTPTPAPDATPAPGPTPGPTPPPEDPSGRVGAVWIADKPMFIDRLPLKLTQNAGGTAEIHNNKIRGGHFWTPLTPENQTRNPAEMLALDIPEGEHLLLVPVKEQDPQSFIGGVLGAARRNLPIVGLRLADNTDHKPVGKFAFAKVGGRWHFEITYLDETARDAGRDIPNFEKIRHNDLKQPGTVYGYLFLLKSGARPTHLLRGNAISVDLTGYQLVAP